MLSNLIDQQVLIGLEQALGAAVIALIVVMVCRRFEVDILRETQISLVRGLLQMAVVGVLLAVLLKGSMLVGVLILLGMVGAAAYTASRRFKDLRYAFEISILSIGLGSGTAIAFMLLSRSLDPAVSVLVPVGSMIIANSMNACAQAMERFRADMYGHVGQIEAALCLGATPSKSAAAYVRAAVYASLLPRLDMLKSLGLVWIPGVMAGMMVSGTSPIYAGIYQFVIVVMILVASGISGMGAVALMQKRTFSPAAQLLLRPAREDLSTIKPA
jgi:putative ABC transport system permease protein